MYDVHAISLSFLDMVESSTITLTQLGCPWQLHPASMPPAMGYICRHAGCRQIHLWGQEGLRTSLCAQPTQGKIHLLLLLIVITM